MVTRVYTGIVVVRDEELVIVHYGDYGPEKVVVARPAETAGKLHLLVEERGVEQ